jgi:hypothetical protein
MSRVFALTICAYKKEGMDEDEYHKYMTERHAASVKDLMIKNKIVSYTMVESSKKTRNKCIANISKQHNTTKSKKMMNQLLGDMYLGNVADYDCIIQIVFKDPQDFVNVKNDPHYKAVVLPDHGHFADVKRTTMVTGWFETHIQDGQDAQPGVINGEVKGH